MGPLLCDCCYYITINENNIGTVNVQLYHEVYTQDEIICNRSNEDIPMLRIVTQMNSGILSITCCHKIILTGSFLLPYNGTYLSRKRFALGLSILLTNILKDFWNTPMVPAILSTLNIIPWFSLSFSPVVPAVLVLIFCKSFNLNYLENSEY